MAITHIRTPTYNTDFDPVTGKFRRWGRNLSDDPQFSPIGPELADIEISTICNGINGTPCAHCYKSNTNVGTNMNLATFKKVLSVLPKSVNQIAFGIGDLDANPDLIEILKYTRKYGIVPNITINGAGLTNELASNLAHLCGAVAVSRYSDKDVCYEAIERLTLFKAFPPATLQQINIHQMLAEETYTIALETIEDTINDMSLYDLNALIFLSLKQKGRGSHYTTLSDKHFTELVDLCFDKQIAFGFDSCSTPKFLNYLETHPNRDTPSIRNSVEPCESSLFSIYVNVEGVAYPCSFCELDHDPGINLLNLKSEYDFLKNVWYDHLDPFRTQLLRGNRSCSIYQI